MLGKSLWFASILLLQLLFFSGCMPSASQESHPSNFPGNKDNSVDAISCAEITLAFVGDIRLSDKIGKLIEKHGVNYPWEYVGPILRGADAAFGNLETVVGTGGVPQDKKWTFQSRPETLAGMVEAGITAVSLANNHIGDYGPEGITETISNLEAAGIKYAGAGINSHAALKPLLLEKAGFKIGFIAASRVVPTVEWIASEHRPGLFSAHDEKALITIIATLAKEADVVIASIHWGEEGKDVPSIEDRNLAHRLARAGADVIIGHHPHVLQGFERFEQSLIAYSLGNFVFTFSSNPLTPFGGILLVDVGQQGITGARFIPTQLRWGRPEIMAEQEAGRIFDNLTNLSKEMGVTLNGRGDLLW